MVEFEGIITGIIFIAVISFVLVSVSNFVAKPFSYDTGAFEKADLLVEQKVNRMDVLLSGDCNASVLDCNRFFAFRVDLNDLNFLSSNGFRQVGRTGFSFAKLNSPVSVFLHDLNSLIGDQNDLGFSYGSVVGRIFFRNSFLDANLFDSNLELNFLDVNERKEIVVVFDRNFSFSVSFNGFLFSARDNLNNFGVYAFANLPEIWFDLPSDQNLLLQSNQLAFSAGDSNGLLASEWFDDNYSDNVSWSYRVPFTVFSNAVDRNSEVVRIDLNFFGALNKLGDNGVLDANSIRVAEFVNGKCVDFNSLTPECDSLDLNFGYNSITGIGVIDFNMRGFTDKNVSRSFGFFFDSNSNSTGIKRRIFVDMIYSAPGVLPVVSIFSPDSGVSRKMLVADKLKLFEPNVFVLSFEAGAKKRWKSGQFGYRLPFVFESGNFDRTNSVVSKDINFLREFSLLNCNACVLNQNSLELFEVDDLENARVLSDVNFSFSFNDSAKIGSISWTVSGITIAKSKRNYVLYFNKS